MANTAKIDDFWGTDALPAPANTVDDPDIWGRDVVPITATDKTNAGDQAGSPGEGAEIWGDDIAPVVPVKIGGASAGNMVSTSEIIGIEAEAARIGAIPGAGSGGIDRNAVPVVSVSAESVMPRPVGDRFNSELRTAPDEKILTMNPEVVRARELAELKADHPIKAAAKEISLEAAPTIAALGAATETGAAMGRFGGIPAFVGGFAAALVAGGLTRKAEDLGLEKLLGADRMEVVNRQLAVNREAYPLITLGAQMAPQAAFLRPASLGQIRTAFGVAGKLGTDEGAALLKTEVGQKAIGDAINMAVGSGSGAALEAWNQIQAGQFDAPRLVLTSILGGVLSNPTEAGKAIGLGAESRVKDVAEQSQVELRTKEGEAAAPISEIQPLVKPANNVEASKSEKLSEGSQNNADEGFWAEADRTGEAVPVKPETILQGVKVEPPEIDAKSIETFDNKTSPTAKGAVDVNAVESKTIRSIEELILQETPETERRITTTEKQGFALNPLAGSNSESSGGNVGVATTLAAGRIKPQTKLNEVAREVKDMAETLDRSFIHFMPELDEIPQLRNDYRTQFMPMRRRVYEDVGKMRFVAMGALERAEGRRGVNHATDIIFTRDLLERARSGQDVPNGLSEQELRSHLNFLESTASPEVNRSVALIRETLDIMGGELVSRGKLTSSRSEYAPHQVLDYIPGFLLDKMSASASMPKAFGEPYRSYTKKSVGSKRLIETSENTLWAHVAKVQLDNASEDWMLKQADKYDRKSDWRKQNPGQNLRTGQVVIVDGVKHRAIRWKKNGFISTAVDENLMNVAINDGLRVDEWLALRGTKGGTPTREVRIQASPTLYLVPEKVARTMNRLTDLADPTWDIFRGLGTITKKWKGVTLAFAGLPYHVGNLVGDTLNTAIFDPAAFRYIGSAARAATSIFAPEMARKAGIVLTPFEKKLIRVANEQDVASSGSMVEVRNYSPTQRAMQKYQAANDWRESMNRMAILAHQLDRVESGLPVQRVAAINVDGLLPEAQAGKVAREALVDYTATPRTYRQWLSNFAAPFVRFHEANFRNHFRTATKQPEKYWPPIAAVYAVAWAFNNLDEKRKQKEVNIPEYLRNRLHVVLWDDKTDEGKAWVWAPLQPVDMAGSWLGLDNIGRIVSDYHAGHLDGTEAGAELGRAILNGTPENVKGVTGPLIQLGRGLLTNRDPFDNSRVMPDAIFDSWKEDSMNRMAWKYVVEYAGKKLLTPIAQYTRQQKSDEPVENPLWNAVKTGPLDWRRALGLYKVDLTKQALVDEYKAAQDGKAIMAYHHDQVYRLFEQGGSLADTAAQQYVEGVLKDGGLDLNWSLNYWKQSSQFKLAITRADMRNAKTEDERSVLRAQEIVQRMRKENEARKGIPKTIRKQQKERAE